MSKPDIKRGPMSAAERAEIERLAAALRRPTPRAIAQRMNRHVATITWYMITHGLIERVIQYGRTEPYKRNGATIYPYCAKQDARLIELRTAHKSLPEIARIMTSEFGCPRTYHSVHVRLMMLAAYEESGATP